MSHSPPTVLATVAPVDGSRIRPKPAPTRFNKIPSPQSNRDCGRTARGRSLPHPIDSGTNPRINIGGSPCDRASGKAYRPREVTIFDRGVDSAAAKADSTNHIGQAEKTVARRRRYCSCVIHAGNPLRLWMLANLHAQRNPGVTNIVPIGKRIFQLENAVISRRDIQFFLTLPDRLRNSSLKSTVAVAPRNLPTRLILDGH